MYTIIRAIEHDALRRRYTYKSEWYATQCVETARGARRRNACPSNKGLGDEAGCVRKRRYVATPHYSCSIRSVEIVTLGWRNASATLVWHRFWSWLHFKWRSLFRLSFKFDWIVGFPNNKPVLIYSWSNLYSVLLLFLIDVHEFESNMKNLTLNVAT